MIKTLLIRNCYIVKSIKLVLGPHNSRRNASAQCKFGSTADPLNQMWGGDSIGCVGGTCNQNRITKKSDSSWKMNGVLT